MTLRLLQVGMGNWGRNWTRTVVRANSEVELVAYVDVAPATLAQARDELVLPSEQCFNSMQEALATVECDAVLITASLAGHVPSATAALRAGKHVLMEKPFAPTLAEAQQLVELAREQRRILMISQNYRFYPAVQKARELIRSEALGPVGAVRIVFRKYRNTAERGTNIHYTIWHPLLADMSIHHFDLMRYVLGQEAAEIYCRTWSPVWSRFDGPASAAALVTFPNNLIINYEGSWVSTGPETTWAGQWFVECAQGEMYWESRSPEQFMIRPLGKEPEEVTLPKIEKTDRSGSLHEFVQAIREGREPESSGQDNLKTLALMLGAITSSETDAIIHL